MGNMRFGMLILCFILISPAVLWPEEKPSAKAPDWIPVRFPSGTEILAEVADTPAQRAMGLMFRKSLAADRGMLFVYTEPGIYSFWMKNCRFPLDILWMGPDQSIVQMKERVPPCSNDPCPVYNPRVEALYAIEVVAGFARREGLTLGSKVRFTLPLPPDQP